MTITNFNYEGSYLWGFICHIVVKADLGRSVNRSTLHPNASWDIYYGRDLAAILDSSKKMVGISCYFWIIWVVNSHLALYRHVRCNPLNTPETPPPKYPQMTIRDFNSDRWYLPWIPVHKTWQMDPTWEWSIDVWNTATPNLADKATSADGPPT